MTRIKICGLMCTGDVRAVNAAQPDYAGFVIEVPGSKRSVTLAQTRSLCALLAPSIKAVGVFVDAPFSFVARLLDEGTIQVAQLHGREDAAYVRALRFRTKKTLVQAFRANNLAIVRRAMASPAHHILLDSKGGSGQCFNWDYAKACRRPFFLAGGLNPHNLVSALMCTHPFCVDISSGVEGRNYKDAARIKQAVRKAHRFPYKKIKQRSGV